MKKTKTKERAAQHSDDLIPEYAFDYTKAKTNRFPKKQPMGSRTVQIDPDVAAVVATSESVNAILRALIQNMPVASTGT